MTRNQMLQHKPHPYLFVGMLEDMRDTKEHTFNTICEIVCDYYKYPMCEIMLKGRQTKRVEVRQICHYFCMKLLKGTQDQIAAYFGQDRTTLIHSVQTVKNRCDTEPEYKRNINLISAKI